MSIKKRVYQAIIRNPIILSDYFWYLIFWQNSIYQIDLESFYLDKDIFLIFLSKFRELKIF
jgi:hypothetical protein